MPSLGRLLFAVLAALCVVPQSAAGQASQPETEPKKSFAAVADAPPPPVPPAVISRDANGKATIRAVRIATPLEIDGHLDEAVYQEVEPISDFIQNDPKEGAPATEKTDVWILFDDDNFYIVGR